MFVPKSGTVSLAMSVAMLLVGGCGNESQSSTASGPLVRCEGINTCKGHSECASADGTNSCQGLNECAGQGWITVPESECREKKGKIMTTMDAASMGQDAAMETGSMEPSDAMTATLDGTMETSTMAWRDAMGDGGGVECEGINSCKGTSECAAADGSHACKGMNDCAGHGWISVPSTEECIMKGGTVRS